MALPDSLISAFGNLLNALVELVGVITGDIKLVFKPASVRLAISANTSKNGTDENNNTRESEDSNTRRKGSIYCNPDIHMSVPELIQKYEFPFESHKVVTKDHYILDIFRIPYGRNGQSSVKDRPPVLLVHGLLNSAGAWVMHQPGKALAYMLADKGYDCWMLNCRGCTYSREHRTLSATDKEFWNFSFHEMGTMDVPAVINHILNTTGHQDLYYIGHSLGNTKLMIAMNEDESINKKIKLLVAFAPAVYLYETTAKLLSLNAPFFKQQKAILDYFTGCGELMGKTFVKQFQSLSSFLSPEYLASKCVTASMYTMGGHNPDQIYWPQIPVIAGHTPSSSSVRTYIHCLQYFSNPEFQQYDYGSSGLNTDAYGQPTPPKYDLKKVTCPTVIFWGENDLLCRPSTVEQLSKELPNLVGSHRVDCDRFSHTDFLYAKDVDTLLYNRVIQLLN